MMPATALSADPLPSAGAPFQPDAALPGEDALARLGRLARHLLGVPVALVCQADQDPQQFRARLGALALQADAPRREPALRVVADVQAHDRLRHEAVLQELKARFFASCPLQVAGWTVGSLCLLDRRARNFSSGDERLLRELAAMAESALLRERCVDADRLPGLLNGRGFAQLGRLLLRRCRERDNAATLMSFELDAPPGGDAGTAERQRFALLLGLVLGTGNLVAQLGPQRFAVLSAAGSREIDTALDRLLLASRPPPTALSYTVSCQVLSLSADDVERALQDAEPGLRAARRAKGGLRLPLMAHH